MADTGGISREQGSRIRKPKFTEHLPCTRHLPCALKDIISVLVITILRLSRWDPCFTQKGL